MHIYSSDVPNVERMHGKMCISPAVHFIFAFLQALFSRPPIGFFMELQSVSHVFIKTIQTPNYQQWPINNFFIDLKTFLFIQKLEAFLSSQI